jgi:hypothetical protein
MDNLKERLETDYNLLNKDVKSYIKRRHIQRMLITGISAFLTVIILRAIF